MRRIVAIPFETSWLAATLDGPSDATNGWVFVTGGSQTRVGPHRLYERLAHAFAEAGDAVIRFDRCGVGDSPGTDAGYLGSAPEIGAAANTLRTAFPSLTQLSGFGLCDGSTALALYGAQAGIDRLVLANPWAVELRDDLPPAAAIRGHYARRLVDPAAWRRLLGGGVNLRRLVRGLARTTRAETGDLATRIAAGLPADSRIVLATGDGTAQAFDAAWRGLAGAPAVTIERIATASHSFADPAAFTALEAALTRRR